IAREPHSLPARRSSDLVLQGEAEHALLGAPRGQRGDAGREVGERADVEVRFGASVAHAAADVLVEDVARDAEQEGAEAAVGPEALDRAGAQHERALGEVVGLVARLAGEEAGDGVVVALDQGLASGPVPPAPGRDELGVVAHVENSSTRRLLVDRGSSSSSLRALFELSSISSPRSALLDQLSSISSPRSAPTTGTTSRRRPGCGAWGASSRRAWRPDRGSRGSSDTSPRRRGRP